MWSAHQSLNTFQNDVQGHAAAERVAAEVESHFKGQNLYLEEMSKNIRFIEDLTQDDPELSSLRRQPPDTLKS